MPKKRWSDFRKNPCLVCHGAGSLKDENNIEVVCEPCGGTGRGELAPPEGEPDKYVVTAR
ncbi:MAG TPA: hypothetical protein VFK07_01175 [Candidatus Paceibacterota bacterium]|nr:hypothetical protein [Candidatus Paceibacterota bacterium]